MLEWLIVGGGIHGTYISHYLKESAGVAADRIRVLDPHPEPLARWEARATNTGMEFLRSPLVHHIGIDPFDLHTFSNTKAGKPLAKFTWPYDRPALALFRAHSRHVIERRGLDGLRIRGWARGLSPTETGARVETDDGALDAKRVVLALGPSEQPDWPDWAFDLKNAGAPINHVFDTEFVRDRLPDWTRAVVVGGGITAAQTALAMAERAPGTVTLLARHEIREHQFDSDPGWIGPKHMDGFLRERNHAKRRAMIVQARHRGSLPPDAARALRIAVNTEKVNRLVAPEWTTSFSPPGEIRFEWNGGSVTADRVVLATGFDTKRPGGEWLTRAVENHGIVCGECGYPIVNKGLRWHKGIFVTGPLAELELGPTARNIAGARRAAERLAASA